MNAMKLFIASNTRQNLGSETGNSTEPVKYIPSVNNDTGIDESFNDDEYIFDRTDIRAIFITLYTLVFCCCFF
ncbi:hypothetical protein ABMA28_013540, partial [Loxostege sticticalis]